MMRLIYFVAGVLLSAPAFAPQAGAQVVSPADVAISLPTGARGEVTLVVTNEGGSGLVLFAVPLPKEGAPEDVGEMLFSTEPGEAFFPLGMTMTPDGRIFVADDSGQKTREYTPELEYLRVFRHPEADPREFSHTTGLAWMPPEHAPPGYAEGTLWWMDVQFDPEGPQIFVESVVLIEGNLDGSPSGRTVELAVGPGYPPHDRGVPMGVGYEAESGLLYYVDTVNEDIYAIDVNGDVAEGYPVPLTNYDDGSQQTFAAHSDVDVTAGVDGGMYLETTFMIQEEGNFNRAGVVVTDLQGRSTGVETPLTRLYPPDGQGEVIRVMGVLRSRLDPKVMYLAILTQHQSGATDWIVAIRAHPLPPRWLRVSPVAPEALMLAPSTADTLTVRLDAEGLAVGTYEGQVALRRDSPNGEEVVTVPVVLTVTEGTATEAAPEAAGPLRLLAPYPNPAHGPVTVPLVLAQSGAVRVAVYDVLGREVAVLHDGPLAPGEHAFQFAVSALPAGVYVVRATGGVSLTRRIVLAR